VQRAKRHTSSRSHRVTLGAAGVVLALVVYLIVNFARHDLETRELDDAARRAAGGRFVALADGQVHYELAGPANGSLVVLVHGFSVPFYLWDHTFTPLVQAGFRVLRYDLYGRGASDRPSAAYGAALYDRQLAQLLAAVGLRQPVHLVGASMGGGIAVRFVASHPRQVRSLSLIGPEYHPAITLPLRLRAPVVGEYVWAVTEVPDLPRRQTTDFIHPERYPSYFERYRQQMRYRGFRWALLSTIRELLPLNSSVDYRRAAAQGEPILLIWGTEDHDVPFEFHREVLTLLKQAEFHPLPGMGHVPYYEAPELVNPLLIDFVRRHSPAAGSLPAAENRR
jgi:pimeloyl-ACP methyl ester carboxylesterase